MVTRTAAYGNNPIPYKNRRWLYEMYWGHNLSMPQVAERAMCSRITIVRWMDRLNVPRRDVSAAVALTYDTVSGLRELRSKHSIDNIWSDPAHREFMREVSRNIWSDPEFREMMERRMMELWSDPDYVKSMVGENAPNWHGGISGGLYDEMFTDGFKRYIRSLDGNHCVLCRGIHHLCVHHIDYDKMNTTEDNCVTLCTSCHGRTNVNRVYWRECFVEYLESCKELVQ